MDEVRELELAEANAWRDSLEAVAPGEAARMGIRVGMVGPMVATAIAAADVLAFNRAVGAGLGGPLAARDLDALLDWFRGAGVRRFFLPLAPGAAIEETRAVAESRGLRPHNNWLRLVRDLEDLPPDTGAAEVRAIGPGDAATFGALVTEEFRFPPLLAPIAGAAVGRPGWIHYLAWLDGEPAGTAALYLSGAAAWFGFATTRGEVRGRGVQSQLIRRRLHDARARGCRVAVSETAEPRPGHDAPSSRNLARQGFRIAYARANYLHEDASAG
jgi:GNAT superfamily N-acetyltransferase